MRLQLFSIYIALLFYSIPTFSQEIIGQIIDAQTNEPIAFATVQFSNNNGVVSNGEGFFNIPSDHLNPDSVLSISFMGYESQSLTIGKLKAQNHLIKLKEAISQLNTVYITNRAPRTDSIMARVNRNLFANYHFSDVKFTIFNRQTVYFKANKLKVDIEKSSGFNKKQLEESNKKFENLSEQIINNPPTQTFTDVLSDLYLKSDYSGKMEIIKATKLKDNKNNLSLETIQSKVSNIVLQHLDTTKTYKVKSGWFKIEDSLSLKKAKDIKKESDINSFGSLKFENIKSIKEHLFEKESVLDFVLDSRIYNYKLTNVTTIDDQLVYVIAFNPRKSKAKYKGTLYIADVDYAVLKLDYSYAEGKIGDKLNLKLLFGVKYIENVNQGTVIYKKSDESKIYYPYYINHESEQYIYAHRPFKFIENSNIIKNKVAFDVTMEGTVIQKYELMSLYHKPFEPASYTEIMEPKNVNFTELKQYNPSLWKDYTIMEPLEELKKFKVEDL